MVKEAEEDAMREAMCAPLPVPSALPLAPLRPSPPPLRPLPHCTAANRTHPAPFVPAAHPQRGFVGCAGSVDCVTRHGLQ